MKGKAGKMNYSERDRVASIFLGHYAALVTILIKCLRSGLEDITHTISIRCRRLPVSKMVRRQIVG